MIITVLFGYSSLGELTNTPPTTNLIENQFQSCTKSILDSIRNTCTLILKDDSVSIASIPDIGEKASQQVLSVESSGSASQLPTIDELNKKIEKNIQIFDIISCPIVGDFIFDADCSTESTTFEYLIPTFVFSPPPVENQKYYMSLQNTVTHYDTDADSHAFDEIDATNDKIMKEARRTFEKEEEKPVPTFFESISRTITRTLGYPDNPEEDESLVGVVRRNLTIERTHHRSFKPSEINSSSTPPPTYHSPIKIENYSIMKNYRITNDQIQILKNIMEIFHGSHNFRNYIMNDENKEEMYVKITGATFNKPEVFENGMEWIRIRFTGPVFHLEQVRRMIGMIVVVMRSGTKVNVIANSFGHALMHIPIAPASNLILSEVSYGAPFGGDISFQHNIIQVRTFKKKIDEKIVQEEENEKIIEKWIRDIDSKPFLYAHYLNPEGLIKLPNAFLKE